jgi:hypothetical protein
MEIASSSANSCPKNDGHADKLVKALVGGEFARKPKVNQFNVRCQRLISEQKVFEFEVTVNDIICVNVCNGTKHLFEKPLRVGF